MNHSIKDLIKSLRKIKTKNVLIYITHKLYGDQNIKCAFQLCEDEKRLGFLVSDQEIYMYKNEICDIYIKDNLICFADKIMSIQISKT